MPDEVGTFASQTERDHADRIEDPATQDQDKEPHVMLDHIRDEKQSAPADQEIQRVVKRLHACRPKDADERDAHDDQGPLDTEHDDALGVSPVYETHRSERAADTISRTRCCGEYRDHNGIRGTSPRRTDIGTRRTGTGSSISGRYRHAVL